MKYLLLTLLFSCITPKSTCWKVRDLDTNEYGTLCTTKTFNEGDTIEQLTRCLILISKQ